MADVKPRIKLDKKQAKKGDLVEVKALVSHVMETGQRKDAGGNTIPRKILNKFTCTVNGKEVFSADLEPAISANPYIQFKFRAQESGAVVLTWVDDDGTKIVGLESITVTQTSDSMNLVGCLGFFMTAPRCSLVCDSRNEVKDHDGVAAGVGIDDWR